MHFLYKWSGNNAFIGLFAAINESVWEHTKIIFFPMLFYSIFINKKTGREYPCIKSAMSAGTIISVLLIISLFYTYSGIVGFNVDFVNIMIFYLSVIISMCTAYKLALSCSAEKYYTVLQICLIALVCLYFLFTFFPPDIPLFAEPK